MFFWFPLKNLCFLVTLAVSLSLLQGTHPFVKLLFLYNWQNRESFMQRLRSFDLEHLSSHSALSRYGLFGTLALWRLSVTLRSLVQVLGYFPISGASWSSLKAPFVGFDRILGVGNNSNKPGFVCSLLVDIQGLIHDNAHEEISFSRNPGSCTKNVLRKRYL